MRNLKKEIEKESIRELLHSQYKFKEFVDYSRMSYKARQTINDILSKKGINKLFSIGLPKRLSKFNQDKLFINDYGRIREGDYVRIVNNELQSVTDELLPTHVILECWGGDGKDFHLITKTLALTYLENIEIFKI